MPIGNRNSRREPSDRTTDDGVDQALHELRDSLTVIHAQSQLLQRRIRPRQRDDAGPLIKRLTIIQQASMAMERRLRWLADRHRSVDR